MAANTLNILTPSVNNLTARIFVRAAGLDFEEKDVWGKTTEPEFLGKYPAHLTPMLEEEGLPRGSMGESCAIMRLPVQQARARPVLPHRSGRAGDGRQRELLPDRDVLPAGRARDVPHARLSAVPGRGGDLGARATSSRRRPSATPRRRSPSRSRRSAVLPRGPTVHRRRAPLHRRHAALRATLEFLKAIDYAFPSGPSEYMDRVESTLGDAYSEPAGDVRGFVASVKG